MGRKRRLIGKAIVVDGVARPCGNNPLGKLGKIDRRGPCCEWPNCECPRCEVYRRRKELNLDRGSFKLQLCAYCGAAADTRDHTVPRSRGGRHTVPCCRPCNQAKADLPYTTWMLIVLNGLLPVAHAEGTRAALEALEAKAPLLKTLDRMKRNRVVPSHGTTPR